MDFSKELLEGYYSSFKNTKKLIKLNIVSIIIDTYLILYYLYTLLHGSNKTWLIILYAVCFIFWSFILYTNIKSLKKNKTQFKINTELYYNQLKIVDYPKYIKEQRIKKLKKLKR